MFLAKNYNPPKSSSENYVSLEEGETRLRILSDAIWGWEDWENRKPMRFTENNKPNNPVDPKSPVKFFCAMIAWNYKEEKIQILQFTKAGIRKGLEKLAQDADWGLPFFYDVKIIKTGQKEQTSYSVNPVPHSPIIEKIIDAFREKPCY